ncbi:fatty acid-binding protein [Candidatus Phytoplasma luffae]|uniref:Fatty acid-binding protein n=1 Tax=Loofah witches'-broom phytoplasma TaxID=35773 RepID=A0A975INB1_LOWBP|nr:DegV family protein [Candidatus Phytoplasma luffae]QTX02661.1 fatty acid-binding protein [Candidatus Phytoplasma luffae]
MGQIDIKKEIKVASTSTSCLDYYPRFLKNIDLIRIKIHINNETYIDGETIKASTFYDMMEKDDNLIIKTSQPSVGELVLYFKKIAQEGYKKIFVTTISKKLSGSYNSVIQAQKQVKDLIEVIPYDTNTVCFSEGFFALTAQRLFEANTSITNVIEQLDFFKKNNTIFFVVNSLNQLINNGRLSRSKSFIGRLFRIKPILQVNKKGEIVLISKKINIDKAFYFIVKKIKNYTKNKKFLIHILTTGNNILLKTKLKEILKKEFNLEDVIEVPSSPAVGAHVGNNVVGVGVILLK